MLSIIVHNISHNVTYKQHYVVLKIHYMDPSSIVKISLGNKIKELRRAKDLSQEEFAKLTDLNRSYVSTLENGKKNVTIDNLVKIALCLDVPLPYLFELPSNMVAEDPKNEYLTTLFLTHGFFNSLLTLGMFPGSGITKKASKVVADTRKKLLNKLIRDKKD